MPLERFDDGRNTIVTADPQVVPLRDIVGEHDAGVLADPRQHREQHATLKRLRLVDDDERIVERASANVRQWQHLEQVAVDDLVDDVWRNERAEGVEDSLSPGRHLLRLGAREVTELLPADGIERTEDDDPPVLVALHHRFEPRAQRECRLSGAGATTQRDDADVRVEQQVEYDALLGAAAVHTERVAVTAYQPHLLVWRDATE